MNSRVARAALVAMGVGVLAACEEPAPPNAPAQDAQIRFEDVDTNGDGVITSQEGLQAPAGFDFAKMDVDKSNSVSRQEFATAMALARQRG